MMKNKMRIVQQSKNTLFAYQHIRAQRSYQEMIQLISSKAYVSEIASFLRGICNFI
jgi:hypothetical protein